MNNLLGELFAYSTLYISLFAFATPYAMGDMLTEAVTERLSSCMVTTLPPKYHL